MEVAIQTIDTRKITITMISDAIERFILGNEAGTKINLSLDLRNPEYINVKRAYDINRHESSALIQYIKGKSCICVTTINCHSREDIISGVTVVLNFVEKTSLKELQNLKKDAMRHISSIGCRDTGIH